MRINTDFRFENPCQSVSSVALFAFDILNLFRISIFGFRISVLSLRPRPSRKELFMSSWPLGVFASIDAGLGVHLSVAHELGVPTIQLHAPHAASRTPQRAREFLARVTDLGMTDHRRLRRFRGRELCRHPHGQADGRPGSARNPCGAAERDEGDCRLRPAAGRRRRRPAHRLRAARRSRTRPTGR